MLQYLTLMRDVLVNGEKRKDRTGVGTRSLFGEQLHFDLDRGFPLVTTKKIHFRSVLHELLWFLQGSENIGYLKERGIKIWDEWADQFGGVGPIYGFQWRQWDYEDKHDQIRRVIRSIKEDPTSRRHVVSAWNPPMIPSMALAPCHVMFQFYVSNSRALSCHMYQRSADIFLGLPFNIASYATLTMMIARVCNLDVGKLVISIGDAHLYENHIEQAELQLSRGYRALPELHIDWNVKDIDDFVEAHFELLGYDPHPAIKAPVAV